MAIAEAQAWVGASVTGPSSVTATYGSTPTQGNLMLAIGRGTTAFSNAALSGWTLIAQTFSTSASASPFALWYKIAGAAESTSVSLTWTSSANISLVIGEYSGMRSSPLDASNSVASNGVSGLTKVSSDSPATIYPYELCVAVIGHNGGLGTLTWSNSFTHRITVSAAVLTVATRLVYQKGIYGTTLTHTVSRLGGGIIATFAGKDQHGLLGIV